MYSTRTAYLLWFASFFGFAGLHRLYLGKFGSGVLYLLTMGLFGLGTIYDGVTMADQVREARIRYRMHRALDGRLDELESPDRATHRPMARSESPEHVILRVAKASHGIASPASIALEGQISTDEARKQLDALVDKGIGEVRVRKNGTIAYVFPDFLDDHGAGELEQF